MKKILLCFILFLVTHLSFAFGPMHSIYNNACTKYDALTGKVVIELTHGPIGGYPSGPFYAYYNTPIKSWAYVKNPSGPGYWGPFACTGIYDPATVGASDDPKTYYDVVIPGFSTQQCYEVYFVSNRWIYLADIYDTWGFVPPVGLDPTITNYYTPPVGGSYMIASTGSYTACICPGSDVIPPCNSHFRLDLSVNTRGASVPPPGGAGVIYLNVANINLHEFNPLSTYTYEWDGIAGGSSSGGFFSPLSPGTHTVCVTEHNPDGNSCRTCMTFCVPEYATDTTGGGGGSGMMRKTKDNPMDRQLKNEIVLYPNPASDKTEMKFLLSQKEIVSISVNDMSGRKIMDIPTQLIDKGLQKTEINTKSLPAGMYQVQIKIGNTVTTQKLSVLK